MLYNIKSIYFSFDLTESKLCNSPGNEYECMNNKSYMN